MGEAVYTLKADFKSESAAIEGAKKIDAFLQETQKAYWFWQDNRGKTPEQFWPIFKKDFPQVYKFLGSFGKADGDSNNGLSGQMSLVEGRPGDKLDIKVNAAMVTYKAEVWHWANWKPFADFVMTEYGASGAMAKSSED